MAATKAQTLSRPTFGDRLIRFIFWRRRLSRLLFPSPAEVRFVRVMHGHVLTIPIIKSWRTHYPLAIVWRGRILKRELVEREVWADERQRYCLDFATRDAAYRKGIEIDGKRYHDILKDQERDAYLKARGWDIKRIPARRLMRDPRLVYVEVCKFLKS